MIDSISERGLADSGSLRPLGYRHGFSLELNNPVGAYVSHLFFLGSPANVARLVVSSVVNSVYGMLRTWSRTNVAKERRKVVSPFIAHGDSFVAVSRGSRFAVTSTDHTCPGDVFFGMASIVAACVTMSCLSLSCLFDAKASATLGVPALERSEEDLGRVSTLTLTDPVPSHRTLSFSQCQSVAFPQDRENAESHAFKIVAWLRTPELDAIASTTGGLSNLQGVSIDRLFGSAVAETNPVGRLCLGSFFDGPSPESHSGQILASHGSLRGLSGCEEQAHTHYRVFLETTKPNLGFFSDVTLGV